MAWFLLLAFVIAPSSGGLSFGEDMSSTVPEETLTVFFDM